MKENMFDFNALEEEIRRVLWGGNNCKIHVVSFMIHLSGSPLGGDVTSFILRVSVTSA